MKTALVCWLGGRDLEAFTGASKKPGPIQSTLKARPHKQLYLLYNKGLLERYELETLDPYLEWVAQRCGVTVQAHPADVRSPVHYGDIYREASELLNRLLKDIPKEEMTVLVSPGTPQMHAVWLLMCKTSFELPMVEASEEQGVEDVDVPFDIAADFIPGLLAESDAVLRRLSGGETVTPAAFESILHKSPLMHAQILKAQKIAERDIPVLILGESGTGKELFAKAIHQASLKAEWNNGTLKTVNCGALTPELVNSELFGYVKGAFTGANADKAGVFEAANGGTVFLDEFGELPEETQVRLLRVLQNGTFNRVGDHNEIEVKVRIIVATNRNLLAEIAQGRFREDLFYRIAVGVLELPPLRQREGDLMLLTDALLEGVNEHAAKYDPGYESKKLSPKARNIIKRHGWPGNVRELQASLTRASVWAGGATISERDMREALLERPAKAGDLLGRSFDNTFDIQGLIKELKRYYIRKALAETGGHKTKSAELLGLKSYQVLNSWMDDLGLKE